MADRTSCHCGDLATIHDPLTGLWECFFCKHRANPDCNCRLFLSPHTKAVWVRQRMEEEYRRTQTRYTEEQMLDARRDAWQAGWLSAQLDYDQNPYGKKTP